jgi:hypothetical protein
MLKSRSIILLTLASLVVGFGLGRIGGGESQVVHGDVLAVLDAPRMRAAVGDALEIAHVYPRMVELVRLMQGLDESNVQGAASAFAERIGSVEEDDIRLFVGTWAGFDPRSAFDAVLDWKLPSRRRVGVGAVVRAWALTGNPAATLEYLRDVAEWRTRDGAYVDLVAGWVGSGDVDGATEFVSRYPDSNARDILTEALVKALLAREGPDELMQWADAVPLDAERKFKKTAFRKALRQASSRDPVRASVWFESHRGEDYALRMLAVVAAEWVEVDPDAAIAWVLAQSPGPAPQGALERLMNRWVKIDPNAATAFMRDSEPHESTSPMLFPFIIGIAATDPAEASRWIERVSEEREREQAIVLVAVAWRRQNAPEAQAWVDSLELSDELRRRLVPAKRRTRESSEASGSREAPK